MEIIAYLKEFNLVSVIVRIIMTVICSSFIGIERGKHGRAAGLRTHILVCIGSAITAMTGLYMTEIVGTQGDAFRISAQVISGIGFLGAGTILVRNKSMITGLTTAASIWATASIGIAIGYGFYEVAIICTIIIFFVSGKLGNLDRKFVRDSKEVNIYIEFIDARKLNHTLNQIKEKYLILNVSLTSSKTNNENSVGANIMIVSKAKQKLDADKIINEINDMENVNFAIVL